YRGPVDPAAVLEGECRARALVVVAGVGRREAYWRGRRLEVDWFAQQAPWDLLVALAEQAASGRGADAFTLGGGGTLKDRRYRLRKLLPADLDAAIRPAGRGTYR